jgi:preprotein translocase subunit SecF
MTERTSPDVEETTATPAPSRRHGVRDLAARLYSGDAGLDIIGKRKIYYAVAAAIMLVGILTFSVKGGFNLGIEFKGGNSFTVPASVGSLDDAREAFVDAGAEVVTAQSVEALNGERSYLIKTAELDPDPTAASQQATEIKADLADQWGIPLDSISESSVSGSFGASIAQSALIGSLVFLLFVVIYLTLALREWRMAVAAIAALIQNMVLTATVYLLVGFEVTPATIIGFLTILGFALYDVVVVFDKVRENTRGITGNPNRTYGEAANLAVNQTLMRSINTSVVALLPVGGLLFIGAGLLGAGTLKDLGLVLFVGMLVAVYSSIFFATPVLVDIKEAEPKFKLHKQRVLARRSSGAGGERKQQLPALQRKGTTDGRKANDATAPEAAAMKVDPALAGTAPRTGARPQGARKRSGGGKSGGGKSGSRPGGSRSGGRKR